MFDSSKRLKQRAGSVVALIDMSTSPALREIPLRSTGYGSAAALGGMALWLVFAALGVERAYPALLLGLGVGLATRAGASYLWPAIQGLSTGITAFALVLGQYLAVRQAVADDLRALGHVGGVPWILAPDAMLEITFSWLGLYPLDIVFWVGALAIAWLVPAARS
jgi:hypothetical protein